jgi:hypothetical protein
MASTSVPSAKAVTRPFGITADRFWLGSTALLAVLVYYFVGMDEGATSVFGHTMYIHEFVHDARHLLGFPCH